MRKILLSAAMFAASAGATAAEVALTGRAEFGVHNNVQIRLQDFFDEEDRKLSPTRFFQDVDATFMGTGVTDNGTAFGASVDLDEIEAVSAGDNDAHGGVAVFLSGRFGTLTLGDTDGALDWALAEPGDVANPGSLNDEEIGHAGYNDDYMDGLHDGQILRYDNTLGNFGFALSAEMDDGARMTEGMERDPTLAFGSKLRFSLFRGTFGLGLGAQSGPAQTSQSQSERAVLDLLRDFFVDLGLNIDPDLDLPPGPDLELDALLAAYSVTYVANSGFGFGVQYGIQELDVPAGMEDSVNIRTHTHHLGLGVGYFGSRRFSYHVNYGHRHSQSIDVAGVGVAVGYSLGDGVSLNLGANSSVDVNNIEGFSGYSLGYAMSF